MNHIGIMRGSEALGGLNGNEVRRMERHGLSADELAQTLALDELHDNVFGIAFHAEVVDGDDGRMLEPACGAGLTHEARLAAFSGAGFISLDHLQRHETLQIDIEGLIDHAHPALAEFFLDAVGTEAGAYQVLAGLYWLVHFLRWWE